MQTKQPATKKHNGSKKKSNRKSENTLRQMQIKVQLSFFFFFFCSSLDITKVVLRGKFIAIQVCLKMKKNLRQQPSNKKKRTNKVQSQGKEGNNKILKLNKRLKIYKKQ